MSNYQRPSGPLPAAPPPKPPRRTGAIVLAVALALFAVGGLALPSVSKAVLEPAASDAAAVAGTAEASPAAPGDATPSSVSGATQTAAPLETETPVLVAQAATAPDTQAADATRATELLATLPVKGRAPKTGYDRSLFGQAWADVDRNGCDTRNDTLKRDLAGVTYVNSVPCKVKSGTLADPYTGRSISFIRGQGTSNAVQIDHVVALSDAWQKGAQQLSTEQRTAFANDPLNLQATDGPTNMKKGDGDAATWLPPNRGFRCEYVARQIAVKAAHRLWVTQAEHDAMARILGDCPGQPASAIAQAPAPSPAVAKPAPVAPAAPAPAPAAAHYANCAAARAAGVAPLHEGQPGYRAGLDRDLDGVACEG